MPNLRKQVPVLIPIGFKIGRYTVIDNNVRFTLKIGKQAGKLSVIHCRVRCECGFETLVRHDKLKKDGQLGCYPCSRPAIPLGTRFNKYLVIANDRRVILGRWKFRACLVRCDCGVEREVAYMNLKSGNSGSCGGCRRGQASLKPGTLWGSLFSMLRNRSSQYGRVCELSLDEFIYISLLPCAYCNTNPYHKFHRRPTIFDGTKRVGRICDRDNPLVYSGIDRVDSSEGYSLGNVVPCCGFCNRAKDDWTLDEFIERLRRLGSSIDKKRILSLAESLKEQRHITSASLEGADMTILRKQDVVPSSSCYQL